MEFLARYSKSWKSKEWYDPLWLMGNLLNTGQYYKKKDTILMVRWRVCHGNNQK